uniref:Uncharacterized protein n=1 Tax=Glossina pallidipes TaxID=7398 RepID=A0A1A9ZV45_GLOPL
MFLTQPAIPTIPTIIRRFSENVSIDQKFRVTSRTTTIITTTAATATNSMDSGARALDFLTNNLLVNVLMLTLTYSRKCAWKRLVHLVVVVSQSLHTQCKMILPQQ